MTEYYKNLVILLLLLPWEWYLKVPKAIRLMDMIFQGSGG